MIIPARKATLILIKKPSVGAVKMSRTPPLSSSGLTKNSIIYEVKK
jgi:hypothetical protein